MAQPHLAGRGRTSLARRRLRSRRPLAGAFPAHVAQCSTLIPYPTNGRVCDQRSYLLLGGTMDQREPSRATTPERDVSAQARRWWALGVIGLVQLMVVLDATIVNIALPSAQSGLGLSDGDRHWVITGYVLAFGGLLLLGGRIGDRLGTRRVLLAGLFGFAVASIIGGAAINGPMLFAARAFQGLFAALIAPAALSLLSTMFSDPKERGIAFGVYGALSSGGAAVGLLAGGLLTEYLDWRWCLYVNVPIAVVALVGAVVTIPAVRPAPAGRLDLPGALLSCAGFAAIVLGFAQAESRGWSDPIVLGLLAGGALLLAALVRVEATVSSPLLPLRVIAHRGRGASLAAVALSQVSLFGFFLFITYYMQVVLDWSPVRAGVAFLPLTAAIAIGASVIAVRAMPRTGPRPLIVGGLLLAAGGMAALTQLDGGVNAVYLTFLLPAQLAIGLGLGLVMMPAMNTATAGVDPQDAGVASATVNAAQQIGGAMGTALLNTVAAIVTAGYLHDHGPADHMAATVEGYTTAIAVGAAILAATAILTAVTMPGPLRTAAPQPR
ncbi:MFS transporter [Saccharopolyspora sp. NPDC050642]|uniref:MFS transporter n=1 Tax=Saccharopolyspora sp. NPDC050642 TaxID=3157099 RepID=UPI0033C2345F